MVPRHAAPANLQIRHIEGSMTGKHDLIGQGSLPGHNQKVIIGMNIDRPAGPLILPRRRNRLVVSAAPAREHALVRMSAPAYKIGERPSVTEASLAEKKAVDQGVTA